MSLVPIPWTNFTAGELSDRLGGQFQYESYHAGARVLENMVVYPHGGASRRGGTGYIGTCKYGDKATRLIKFVWSTEQTYLLEFGDQYVRVYKDQALQIGSGDGTELATNGDFATDTDWTKGAGWTIASEVANCDGSQTEESDLSQTVGATQEVEYVVEFTLSDVTAGSIIPKVGDTPGTARSENGTWREVIAAGEGGDLVFTADADFVGKVDDVSLQVAVTYEIETPFTEDILEEVQFCHSADVMYLTHKDLPPQKLSRLQHINWTLEEVEFTNQPDEWGEGQWPRAVSFFEQRCYWSGTIDKPQTHWLSMAGSYEDITLGTEDDSAMAYTMNANDVNPILWTLAQHQLIIGTSSGVWLCGARTELDPITYTNVKMGKETGWGAGPVPGRVVADAVLYVGSNRKRIFELSATLNSPYLQVRDLMLLAEHMGKPKINGFDWAQDPDATLWATRDDGVLLSGTYYPAEKVLAWCRQTTKGLFKDRCVLPGAEKNDVYFVVQRTVGGEQKQFIELLESADVDEADNAFFVDSGLSYYGEATDTVTGMDHLAGETVQVLADGATHPDVVVAQDGTVTLKREANTVHMGLPYVSTLETLPADVNSGFGTMHGKLKRVAEVTVNLLRSGAYLEYGTSVEAMDQGKIKTKEMRKTTDLMDTAPPLYTGYVTLKPTTGHERESCVALRQTLPLPMHVLSIIADVEI